MRCEAETVSTEVMTAVADEDIDPAVEEGFVCAVSLLCHLHLTEVMKVIDCNFLYSVLCMWWQPLLVTSAPLYCSWLTLASVNDKMTINWLSSWVMMKWRWWMNECSDSVEVWPLIIVLLEVYISVSLCWFFGGTENDIPSKLQGMKLQGMKIARSEIARRDKYIFIVVSTYPSNFSSIVENLMYVIFTVNCSLAAALSTRIDSILLNFSVFSCIVMLTLQHWNCVMWQWYELKKDPMIHVTSLREELSEQVTTPTILICNINNETTKICSSCKQFSTLQCIQIREHCYIYDKQA